MVGSHLTEQQSITLREEERSLQANNGNTTNSLHVNLTDTPAKRWDWSRHDDVTVRVVEGADGTERVVVEREVADEYR